MRFQFAFFFALFSILIFSSCSTYEVKTNYVDYEVKGPVKAITYFNEDNSTAIEIVFNKDGQVLFEKYGEQQTQFIYNDDKSLSKVEILGPNGKIQDKRVYTYDEDYKLVEIRQFDSNFEYRKRTVYEFENGLNTKSITLSAYSDTLVTYDYLYNKSGFVIGETRKQISSNFIQIFDYILDENNLKSIIKSYNEDSLLLREQNFTNFNGVALQVKDLKYWGGQTSDSTLYEYTFDEKGNWNTRTTIENSQKKKLVRKVEYYLD